MLVQCNLLTVDLLCTFRHADPFGTSSRACIQAICSTCFDFKLAISFFSAMNFQLLDIRLRLSLSLNLPSQQP